MKHLKLFEDIEWEFEDEEFGEGVDIGTLVKMDNSDNCIYNFDKNEYNNSNRDNEIFRISKIKRWGDHILFKCKTLYKPLNDIPFLNAWYILDNFKIIDE